MKTILFILLISLFSIKQKIVGCLQLDLILIGDMSTSVNGYQKFISNSFSSFVNKFELSEEGVKIGVITFNNSAYLISGLSSNKDILINNISTISDDSCSGTTNLYHALLLSSIELNGDEYRKDFKKMIIIVCDGDVDNPLQSLELINNFKNNGITICSILITAKGNKPEFMKEISSDCYLESEYETLGEEMRKLDVCL